MSKPKQSSIYLDEDLKKTVQKLIIDDKEKYQNLSIFINEAVREKLEKLGVR
ncbi:hypothetical protein D3C71_2225930 [compost metagenome]